MKTLVLLHRHDKWKAISSVVSTVIQSPHAGFFTNDDRGRAQPVSPEAVRRALSDARFWHFIEIGEEKSRLTDRGSKIKQERDIDANAMESAIADTLEEQTSTWTGGTDIVDVQKFLDELRAIPNTVIPTPDWLWSEFTRRHPQIFQKKRLSRDRFRQFLLLLGRNGTSTLDDVPMRGYFLPKDVRLKNLRPSEQDQP